MRTHMCTCEHMYVTWCSLLDSNERQVNLGMVDGIHQHPTPCLSVFLITKGRRRDEHITNSEQCRRWGDTVMLELLFAQLPITPPAADPHKRWKNAGALGRKASNILRSHPGLRQMNGRCAMVSPALTTTNNNGSRLRCLFMVLLQSCCLARHSCLQELLLHINLQL
eukprot:scpid72298/ scgid13335/ 